MGTRRANAASMFSLGVTTSLFLLLGNPALLAAGQSFLRAAAETNVNQRYTIESVSIGGVKVENAKIPSGLRHRMNALVGEQCDIARLEDLAGELRRQLNFQAVSHHLSKGSEPGRIRVNFDVVRKDIAFDLSIPKFLYNSALGWTGKLDAGARVKEHEFTLGAVNNGDNLTERFTGVVARYEDSRVGSDRVRFRIGFESFHDQWSDQTRTAATGDTEIYRTRRDIAPEVTLAVARNVTVSAGMSFEQMDARAANAFTGELRYGHKIEGDAAQQVIDAKYSVRVGAPSLGSDYSYSRHTVTLRYEVKSGRQTASDEFMGGAIEGDAPLFERFALGNSSTLRGWDSASFAPLGGTRMAHNTLTWGYQTGEGTTEVFYDAGTLWRTGRPTPLRHSLGLGYRRKMFFMTLAFPITVGRITPVFIAGMSY